MILPKIGAKGITSEQARWRVLVQLNGQMDPARLSASDRAILKRFGTPADK